MGTYKSSKFEIRIQFLEMKLYFIIDFIRDTLNGKFRDSRYSYVSTRADVDFN